MRRNNKAQEVIKELDKLLKIQDKKKEPLIIKRCDFAKQLGCTPHLVSYVIFKKLNSNNEYCISSKKGTNGGIKIERIQNMRSASIGKPNNNGPTSITARTITKQREKEIELCLRGTIDRYMNEFIDLLNPEYVYSKKRVHEMIRDICYIVLRQNTTEKDENLIYLIESAIEYALNINTKFELEPIVTKEEMDDYDRKREATLQRENEEFERQMWEKKIQLDEEKRQRKLLRRKKFLEKKKREELEKQQAKNNK